MTVSSRMEALSNIREAASLRVVGKDIAVGIDKDIYALFEMVEGLATVLIQAERERAADLATLVKGAMR